MSNPSGPAQKNTARLFTLIRENGALILLLIGFVAYAARFLTAMSLQSTDSDSCMFVMLLNDLFWHHGSTSGWMWEAAPYLFPDMLVYFVFLCVTGNGLTAKAAAIIFYYIGFLILTVWIYHLLGGRKLKSFFAAMVLFFAAIASHFIHMGNSPRWVFWDHVGTAINTMVCFALVVVIFRRNDRRSIGLIGLIAILVALGSASDALYIVLFVLPMLATLISVLFWQPNKRAVVMILAAPIAVSCFVGFTIPQHAYPLGLNTGNYTQLKLDKLSDTVAKIGGDLLSFREPLLTYLALMDIGVLIVCLLLIVPKSPLEHARGLAPAQLILLLFIFWFIAGNWSVVFLSGNYHDASNLRYVVFSLWLPVLIAFGFAHEQIARTRIGAQTIIFAAFLVTVWLACHPEAPSRDSSYAKILQLLPTLRELREQEHLDAGLANYWWASSTTTISNETVPVRALSDHGGLYHWLNNLDWYTKGPDNQPPAFRYIIMADLNPQMIRNRYGPPDRVVSTPAKIDIWFYSPENTIRYNPVFADLGNRHIFPQPNQFYLAAAALPSQIGFVEGDSRVVRVGLRTEGAITYGPYVHLMPGRYRIDFACMYLAPATADKLVSFDAVIQTAHGEQKLDQADVPSNVSAQTPFSRTLVIPAETAGGQPSFEVRLSYHGSGDFRVDSLTITHLGP